MVFFDIILPNKKYVELVRGLYKYTVILIIFHILISLSRNGKTINFGFGGNIFNENFVNTFCIFLISYLSFMLIFNELILIN